MNDKSFGSFDTIADDVHNVMFVIEWIETHSLNVHDCIVFPEINKSLQSEFLCSSLCWLF